MNNSFIIGGIVTLASVIVFAEFGLRYIYGYSLTNYGIEFQLFNKFPIYRVPYQKLVSIRLCDLKEIWRPNLYIRFGNRLSGKAVLIHQIGFPLKILITPDSPEEFVALVKGKLSHSKP